VICRPSRFGAGRSGCWLCNRANFSARGAFSLKYFHGFEGQGDYPLQREKPKRRTRNLAHVASTQHETLKIKLRESMSY
jgi:hypothetical protein